MARPVLLKNGRYKVELDQNSPQASVEQEAVKQLREEGANNPGNTDFIMPDEDLNDLSYGRALELAKLIAERRRDIFFANLRNNP